MTMNEIKDKRIELGYTQERMVSLLTDKGIRIDVGTYSKLENGIVLPTDECMKSILIVLQVPYADDSADFDKILAKEIKAVKKANNDVLALIPYGHENAISRQDLTRLTGLSDREVRKAIEMARREGEFIINDEDGKGYYKTNNILEIKAQYQRDTARAMAILMRRKPIRDYLVQNGVKI